MVDRSSKFVATLILTSGPDALAELCRLCEGSGGAGSCGAVGEVGTVGARVTPGPQFHRQEEKTVGQKRRRSRDTMASVHAKRRVVQGGKPQGQKADPSKRAAGYPRLIFKLLV